MKPTKITYWATTIIVAVMMTYSSYAYLTQDGVQQAFRHMGFPDFFRVELAIAKLIGVAVILAPLGVRIKEWAYAGFTITFISAFIAHTAAGDPIANRVPPLIFLVILAISYISYHKLFGQKSDRKTQGQKSKAPSI